MRSSRPGRSPPPSRDDALALLRERRYGEAAALLRRLLGADASDAQAWAALGDALQGSGALDEAPGAYTASLALDERRFAAWWGLGCVQARREEQALAVEAFERVVALQPDRAAGWHNLGKALYELGEIERAIDAMRRAAALQPGSPVPLRGIAVAIPGDPRADAASVRAARRAWAAAAFGAVAPVTPPARPADAGARPLRVGYLSAFFGSPNWMKPVWALLNRHDRSRFGVHLLSDVPRAAVDAGYAAHPDDVFVDLRGLDAAQAAARIAALDLDLLVDLNGYSAPERLAVVAARPARRVVAWFNSFAASGLDAFDAVIADAVVAPPGAPAEFDEPLRHVPGCHLSFEVLHPAPEVAPPPVLAEGRLTFGCAAQLYKLNDGVVATFARILRACPGARLRLKAAALATEGNRAWTRRRFAAQGIGDDALLLEGPEPHLRFLAFYDRVDVALEPFPYGGATTATEALWQGVPVLAFAGDRWAARLAATMLHHAGLADWIAADADDLVAKAVALFHDPVTPQRLAALRAGLRERLRASPACDAEGFTRAMEAIYAEVCAAPPRA